MKYPEYKKEIEKLGLKELYEELKKLRVDLASARLDCSLQKIKNFHLVKELRKKIALGLTLISQRASKVKNE